MRGGSFNFQLGPAAVHRLGHAAHGLDFFNNLPCRVSHVLSQLFHHVATRPWVNDCANVCFFLNDELRVARDARAELGGQCNRLVKAVGVQTLRAAKHRCHAFDGGAHYVVVRILLGQAPAAGLAVGAQHQTLGTFGVKALHDAAPQQPSCAHLGNFQIEIHADCPEKTQTTRKSIDIQSLANRSLHILFAVGEREG